MVPVRPELLGDTPCHEADPCILKTLFRPLAKMVKEPRKIGHRNICDVAAQDFRVVNVRIDGNVLLVRVVQQIQVDVPEDFGIELGEVDHCERPSAWTSSPWRRRYSRILSRACSRPSALRDLFCSFTFHILQ